ncbi:MAG: hypothetical protein ITG02_01195 [Patulibacter sp.]|nr:hypothetical protein [Patulibacter sp.]
MTTFREIAEALVDILEEVSVALVDDDHPGNPDTGHWLNVHRWSSAQVGALPAAWLSLLPDSRVDETQSDGCTVTDELRIALKIAVDPYADGVGDDMWEMERVVDIAVPVVDRAMEQAHDRWGISLARRTDIQFANEQLGAGNVLALVIPLHITWTHPIPD